MSKGEKNRQRIVAAANVLFYRKGYNQTAFSEVAEVCGIPKGNFYYYFKSKDELLEAVIEMRMAGIRQMLSEWDAAIPEPRQRLKRYVQILCNESDDVLRYGCPMGSLNVELGKTQLALRSRASEMFSLFLDWLGRQFRCLGYGDESDALASHLLAATQGIALIANVYNDASFLNTEIKRLQGWIDTL